jgi:hypothetical protein
MSLTTPQAALSTVDLPPAKIKLYSNKNNDYRHPQREEFFTSFFALILNK